MLENFRRDINSKKKKNHRFPFRTVQDPTCNEIFPGN